MIHTHRPHRTKHYIACLDCREYLGSTGIKQELTKPKKIYITYADHRRMTNSKKWSSANMLFKTPKQWPRAFNMLEKV